MMKPLVALITLLYTILLIYWMFIGFGRSQHLSGGYHYNLVPLKTIKMYMEYADKFNVRNWLVNVVGNVAVFVPFGITLPYIFRCRLLSMLMITVMGLVILESLQLTLRRGTFDVDDVLLNTLGVMVGFFIYRFGGLNGQRRRKRNVQSDSF
ncbi:VanZ family protein [Paenibacillus sepulcri]|uniref:VanZ family protein n=1 Tax=Paenibacillus sepulcri TaxID=359917 RepID=A0ABS7C9G8_9BACL|nr:VanZ family protein [Paenibacillus sepulcri]